MTTINSDKLIELVRKSELSSDNEIDAALEKIRAQHGGELPSDAIELSKSLEKEKIITRWHSEKLLKGKYKGFFLGKYKLLGHIGSGGMSSVYLAEHTKMHDLRAIKVLPQSKLGKSSYLARFQQEAKAIASLNHPNIVRAYDIDNQGDNHYIVMEYVDGEDLQIMVKKKGPLSFEKAASYTAQAARGLHHAHESGLIHRDVKPANVLVRKDGQVKLLDLGLALFSDDNESSLTKDFNDKVLGTADYLAPEQALNSHGVDPRADLYGLGCMLYFLLTGHPPFPEGSIAQRIAKHQMEMPKEIRKIRPECPGELEGICWKLLQKDRKYRYSSALQTAEVLEAWLARYKVAVAAESSGSSLRLGEEVEKRSASRSSSISGAVVDTVSNRAGDTMAGKSGSEVLSTSDSGVLVRVASSLSLSSSSSSGSQIDLQKDAHGKSKSSNSVAASAIQATPAGRATQAKKDAARAAQRGSTVSPLPQETRKRTMWIVGLVVMFTAAVLLGVVIAKVVDRSQKTELPAGRTSP
jgi:eukaryotic-like serine/threonine-protein kinase